MMMTMMMMMNKIETEGLGRGAQPPPVVHICSEGRTFTKIEVLDLPWTSRPHDSACHGVARRIVGTGGPGEVWETSIL